MLEGVFFKNGNIERLKRLSNKLERKRTLCICQIIKDEHAYIEEWLEYHHAIGVDKFYLIEDFGSKSHADILRKYDYVELHRLEDVVSEKQLKDIKDGVYRQSVVYDIFHQKWFYKHDFMIFIDVDEFVEATSEELQKALVSGKEYPIIQLHWKNMKASGHIKHPNHGDKYSVVKTYTDYNFVVDNTKMIINCKKEFYNILEMENISCIPHLAHNIRTYDSHLFLRHYLCKSFEEWLWRLTEKGELTKAYWNRKVDDWFVINDEFMEQKKELIERYGCKDIVVKINDYK